MPNRVTQYFLQEEKILQNRIAQTRLQLEKVTVQKNEIVLTSLLSALTGVFQAMAQRQKQGLGQPIAWIHLSYLRSSIRSGACEFQIALYDKAHYLDLNAVYGYWTTPFIDTCLAADQEYYAKIVRAKVVRTQEYEIQSFLQEFILPEYFTYMQEFCAMHLPKLQGLGSYQEMGKEEIVTWLYGEFLGSSVPLETGGGL